MRKRQFSLRGILVAAALGAVVLLGLGLIVGQLDHGVSASESESQARGRGFTRTPGVAPITRDGDEGVQVDADGQKCTFVFFGGEQSQDSSKSYVVVTDVTTHNELARITDPWIGKVWSDKSVATHC